MVEDGDEEQVRVVAYGDIGRGKGELGSDSSMRGEEELTQLIQEKGVTIRSVRSRLEGKRTSASSGSG